MIFSSINFNDGGITARFEKEAELRRLREKYDKIREELREVKKQAQLHFEQIDFDNRFVELLCRKYPRNDIERTMRAEDMKRLKLEFETNVAKVREVQGRLFEVGRKILEHEGKPDIITALRGLFRTGG